MKSPACETKGGLKFSIWFRTDGLTAALVFRFSSRRVRKLDAKEEPSPQAAIITRSRATRCAREESLNSGVLTLANVTEFRPERLDLPAGGSRPMGLTFEPAEEWHAAAAAARGGAEGVVDVLVFINDEEDATEECFRIRVRVDSSIARGSITGFNALT